MPLLLEKTPNCQRSLSRFAVGRGPLGPCNFPLLRRAELAYQLAPPFGWESSILEIPDRLSKGDFEVIAIPLELPVID
jgi:hypothetical protein